MHALRVLRANLSIGVLNLVQYRSDFAIALLNVAISLATQVLGLSVIFSNTAELRGWTADGLLILIGIHFFISGLVGLVVRPSFWFVKLDNILVIFQALFGNAGRWPVPIFPGWMRPVLTFVVPIAFAVTVPAQALTGQLPGVTALLAVGVAVLFLAGSRVFWLVALRRYTGASA